MVAISVLQTDEFHLVEDAFDVANQPLDLVVVHRPQVGADLLGRGVGIERGGPAQRREYREILIAQIGAVVKRSVKDSGLRAFS